MKRRGKLFSLKQVSSTLLMIAALLWLTISIPFVYAAQEVQKEISSESKHYDDCNPFANTTEEKNESSFNTLSEYLHEHQLTANHSVAFVRFYKCHPSDIYVEYHPELISPPPEA